MMQLIRRDSTKVHIHLPHIGQNSAWAQQVHVVAVLYVTSLTTYAVILLLSSDNLEL